MRRVKAKRREIISPFAQRRHEKFSKGVVENEKIFSKLNKPLLRKILHKNEQTLFQRNSLIKQTLFKNTRGFYSKNGKRRTDRN